MRILLLNPNASRHITARMAASARSELDAADELVAVTNADGPPAVRDAATLAAAEAALPALMAPHLQTCDALVLGISLDGAIERLRPAWAGKPALGMTEAALARAARVAPRIGLLTLGAALAPLYRARMDTLLPSARIAGVAAGEMDGAFSDRQPAGVDDALLQLLVDLATTLPADAYVLAGAVLCGHDQALQARLGRPVVDGVRAAVIGVREALAGPAVT